MARVAVLGSCITRDLWPVRREDLGPFLYTSRTSLPALFSPPVAGFAPAAIRPPALREHQHRALVADLTKTALRDLVAFAPTHLIFDFIDERFDLLRVGDAVITHSWELENSGYLDQPSFDAKVIPRLSGGCERLWDRAAAVFAGFVRSTPLANAKLILHSARWAAVQRTGSGGVEPLRDVEIYPGRPVEIAPQNAMLARYEARFAQLMPPMTHVEAPAHRLADAGHRWGLSPFHYVPEYYEAIGAQLAALGVEVPLSPAPAAPNVPAA